MPISATIMKTCISAASAIVLERAGAIAIRMTQAAALLVAMSASAGCVVHATKTLAVSPARTASEAGMVDVQSLVPDIRLEIRYAGANNFTGGPVDGYEAPKCFLHEQVAQALARVEQELRRENLRLKIFDCYRPRRAVLHFMRWGADMGDQRMKAQYYPVLDKSKLIGDYISPTSGHSRGATLDLTLLECHASDCVPLDMGTNFDFFDPVAHTDAPGISALQRQNRHRLRDAMKREGFENYPMEWWHYTFKPEPTPDMAYDFPVR